MLKERRATQEGRGQSTHRRREEDIEVVGVFSPKDSNVILPFSPPPPLSCSLCFCRRSSVTLARCNGKLFLKLGTSLGEGATGAALGGGRQEVLKEEVGWRSGR